MEALSEISSLVKEYISPEVIWLVPCLYALGSIVKKSKRIDDTLIPTILCVVGIFLSALVSFASREPQSWIQWVILAAVSLGQGYVIYHWSCILLNRDDSFELCITTLYLLLIRQML